MAISFNQIPIDIRTVGQHLEFDNSRAVQGLSAQPHVALITGQRLSAGTVAEKVLTPVNSAGEAERFFGHGSQLAQAIEAFKANNKETEVQAIALDDDGAGVAATGTFPFVGTATEDGSIHVYIGGEYIGEVAVAATDTETIVAASVAAKITSWLTTNNMPVSAVSAVGVVTVTALHAGTLGNGIDLRLNYQPGQELPAGITCTPVAMASGATDPDVQDVIDTIGDEQFHTLVCSWADDTNMDLIETMLADRWGPMVQAEGHAFFGGIGTQGALTALGNARNSQFSTLMGGGQSPTPAWVWAAAVAGIDALQTQIDPARPRQTLPIVGVKAPSKAQIFTRAERQILLTDGVATFIVGTDGNCFVERLITTYQTNALSLPDPSYLDVTTMRTLAFLRYSLRNRIALRFPRHKLADDGTRFGPGQAIVTPSSIRAEIIALFTLWETVGLVEGFAQFVDELIVERNLTDPNRVDARLSPDLINQFRVFAGQIQFLL